MSSVHFGGAKAARRITRSAPNSMLETIYSGAVTTLCQQT
jgi:hypothetical protein